MNLFDYVDSTCYFRYDTEDNTIKENESTYFEIAEEFKEYGYELDDIQIEHDCITGYLKRIE